ncbi:hypothetical protein ACFVS7_35640 [Streptomyces rubiginosohelvolus]
MINKLKAWRDIAIRSDETPESYASGPHFRVSVIRLNDLTCTAE